MSILSKLFGGGGGNTPPVQGQDYQGFSIFVDPISDGPRWRIAARIEKEIDGEVKVHQMVRADTLESREAAAEATLAKARMLIDQQGETIFG